MDLNRVMILATLGMLPLFAFAGDSAKVVYVSKESENLRAQPRGQKQGTVLQGTKLTVIRDEGEWLHVSIDGWIWKASTSAENIKSADSSVDGNRPKLELIDFTMEHLSEDPNVSRYRDQVRLILVVRNNTAKRIKAWKALLIVSNAFGDTLFRVRLTDGTADISPGESAEAGFAWDDNIFIDDEPYDKLLSYSKDNLKLALSELQLIQ